MVNNPFLNPNRIADNESTQKKDLKNPFIEAKKQADSANQKKKRKSILFYAEDYQKIVALSKTRGTSIVGLLIDLVEADISSLSESDKDRYKRFLK